MLNFFMGRDITTRVDNNSPACVNNVSGRHGCSDELKDKAVERR